MVGSSGAAFARSAPRAARGRSLWDLTGGRAEVMLAKVSCIWPASRSGYAAPNPL